MFCSLLRPKSNKLNGPPFLPEVARPLDLFPHTRHVEVVLLFNRVTDETMEKLNQEKLQSQANSANDSTTTTAIESATATNDSNEGSKPDTETVSTATSS